MKPILRMMMVATTDPIELQQGILLLNKPKGITSNKALQKVKSLLGIKKAGHTGSLDPLATGMLPLCFGEATKICQFLLDADKCYHATGMLGIKTDTSDAMGKVIAYTQQFSISEAALVKAMAKYRGLITQTPSMYSALKHQGVPLYRLARQRIEVVRKTRQVMIHDLTLSFFDGLQFSITVGCSKGTYIRSLVEDIGDALGVGAHVTQLHRCHTAGFEKEPMYTLEQLENMSLEERKGCFLPIDHAVQHFQAIQLEENEVRAIREGRQVERSALQGLTSLVRLYDKRHQFIGLGELTCAHQLKAKRLLAF